MRRPSIWKTLGLTRTQDRTDIRRAYAKKLKATNPEDDPEGFKTLRAAYEEALDYADNRYLPPEPEDEEAVEAVATSSDDCQETVPVEAYAPEPPRVDPVAEAYFAACDRLEKQLKAHSSTSDDERRATLDAILSSPMLDNIETRNSVEQWLAQLVSRTQPRSDDLVSHLIKRFGWNNRRIDRHQTYTVRQVIQRETDLEFLRYSRQTEDGHYGAWKELSEAPQPLTLWRRLVPKASRSEIRNFLSIIRNQHTTVEADLNADSVRAWEKRLETRDLLSGFTLWMAILSPVCLIGMIVAWSFRSTGALALAGLLALPVIYVVGIYGYEYGYAKVRQAWAEDWRLQQNKWLAYGWAPAILLVLALAALPVFPWQTGIVVLLSAGVAWWAAVTGEVDKSPSDWPWQFRLAVAEVFLVAWWLLAVWDMPAATQVQMSAAVIATCFVSGFGRLPLLIPWLRLPKWINASALVLLAIAAVSAIIPLWWFQPQEALRPIGFAVTAGIVLLHRVPTLNVQGYTAGLWRVLVVCALLIGRGWADGAQAIPLVGTAVLIWAAFCCVVALMADPDRVQK